MRAGAVPHQEGEERGGSRRGEEDEQLIREVAPRVGDFDDGADAEPEGRHQADDPAPGHADGFGAQSNLDAAKVAALFGKHDVGLDGNERDKVDVKELGGDVEEARYLVAFAQHPRSVNDHEKPRKVPDERRRQPAGESREG
jgi:hypothetical protein